MSIVSVIVCIFAIYGVLALLFISFDRIETGPVEHGGR